MAFEGKEGLNVGKVKHSDSGGLEKKKEGLAKKIEPLNAWGQDAKTAKSVRKSLRQEKAMKAYAKGHESRYKAGY